jgi:hypothetical protein
MQEKIKFIISDWKIRIAESDAESIIAYEIDLNTYLFILISIYPCFSIITFLICVFGIEVRTLESY